MEGQQITLKHSEKLVNYTKTYGNRLLNLLDYCDHCKYQVDPSKCQKSFFIMTICLIFFWFFLEKYLTNTILTDMRFSI